MEPPTTPIIALTPISSPTTSSISAPTRTQPPTAVPTPSFPTPLPDPNAYQLREWTEQDALDLVSEMRTHIDPIDWGSDLHYSTEIYRNQYSYRLVELAASEALLRFPDSEHREVFGWNLALAMALRDMPKDYPNDLIVTLLEESLNQGTLHLDESANYRIYAFKIQYLTLVDNLFADGVSVPIFKIETAVSEERDGLYFALRKGEADIFDVVPITSFWHKGNGYWASEPEISDHTGDGIPEFVIVSSFHSGSMRDPRLAIWQWQGEHFINLAEQANGRTIGIEGHWDFLPPDNNNSQPLQSLSTFYGLDFSSEMEQIYAWNGSRYELKDTIIHPPLVENTFSWINYHILIEDYETAVTTIGDLLASWETRLPTNIDPSYPDYLRFQQAWLYALESQPAKTRETLELLIEAPFNPITPTLSLAAQAFLSEYQAEEDAYRACKAAQLVMTDALGAPSSFTDDFIQAWGYAFYGFPCDLDQVWQMTVEPTEHMQPLEGISFLEQAGVNITEKRETDLDQNGITEWAFSVERPSPDGGTFNQWWIAFPTEGSLQFFQLGVSLNQLKEWKTVFPPGSNYPLHFLQYDERQSIISFTFREESLQTKNYLRSELAYGVGSYSIDEQNDTLEFQVTYPESTIYPDSITFRWNPVIEDFEVIATSIPYFTGTYSYEAMMQARKLLFEEAKFEEAIALLVGIQTNFGSEYSPEINYLLGLAYELAGQYDRAIETYWQLWHDYPDSSFALMTQRKLELVNPSR